ncbi:carbohydrate kinase family protein [Streptomyces malaysiensis]|uniref:Uncharacterized protein n=1 Tax=Streptomyces malaysiensis TaxID=92644 RepID=A0A7X6AV65_STRMQ|nr:hypothetical protein [Streptomyces malaysiensis]NIY62542.1 hypothetical protein [Streptomyces malaysiensis]
MRVPYGRPPRTRWRGGRTLVVGLVNRGLGHTLPRLVRGAGQTRATRRFQAGGGEGAHQALIARRLGADVPLPAFVGGDAERTPADLATADVVPGRPGVGRGAPGTGTGTAIGHGHATTGTAAPLIAPDGNHIAADAIDTDDAGGAFRGALATPLTGGLAVHPTA